MSDNIVIVFHNVIDVTDKVSDVFGEIGNINDNVSDVNDDISIIYVKTKNTGNNIIKKPSNELEGFIVYNVNLIL